MHPGAVIAGRWEIVEPLGAGGMGDVYRARHRVSRVEVALKILRSPGGYSKEDATRFEREASAPARIAHPGIVRVLDAGLDPGSGQLFLATELLHGTTLRERMRTDGLRWIIALLDPLAAAHAAGFVHRDLKPENVFIDRSDGTERVKLLDFGLVRSAGGLDATGTGATMGTPWYMAPEQAASARDATPAADVWSVGVMIHEAITGARPFDAASLPALLVQIATQPAVPLSIARPDVPPGLSEIVDRCLDKHPIRRPADAGALARELSRVGFDPTAPSSASITGASPAPGAAAAAVDGYGATLASHREPPPAPPPRPARSRWVLGCALAAAATVALACAGAGAFLYLREPPSRTVEGPGFALAVPADWEPIESERTDLSMHYGAPFDAAEGGARTQVFVSRMPYVGSVETMAAAGAQNGVDNGGVIERNIPAALSGVPAREVEIAYDYVEGSYVQAQRCAVVHSEGWVVGCSGRRSRFDEIRPTCRAIFDSFRFR